MSEHHYEDGSPKKCPKCAGTAFRDVVRSSVDMGVGRGGLVCEVEYLCDSCGESVAYWAYGHFDPSYKESSC